LRCPFLKSDGAVSCMSSEVLQHLSCRRNGVEAFSGCEYEVAVSHVAVSVCISGMAAGHGASVHMELAINSMGHVGNATSLL